MTCDYTDAGITVGDDCDDGDLAVNPDQDELCNDGIDNDCDGSATPCGGFGSLDLSTSLAQWHASSGDDLGESLTALDINGDGRVDPILGAPSADNGVVYLWTGPLAGDQDVTDAATQLVSEKISWLGESVAAAGDVDGDGYGDLFVGATRFDNGAADDAGAVWMVQGPITGTQDIDDVATLWTTETRETRLGATVAALGDADDDGVIDVLALNGSTSGSTVVAYLLSAALPDRSTIDDASASITTDAKHTSMSTGSGPGDLDGDGIAEATVSGESPSSGWSAVFLGPIMGSLTIADSDNIIYGDAASDYTYAQTGCPDLDGDGTRDLLIGSRDVGFSNGAIYLMSGAAVASGALSDAYARIEGASTSLDAGVGTCGGDLDLDGYGDVAVGASDGSRGDGGDRAVYIFHGPVSGSMTTDAATGTLTDEGKSYLPIEALLFLPDLTGDGSSELLLASPYNGEAWLYGGSGI